MSDVERLVIDQHAWSQNELIQHIISRYFILGNQVSDGVAWEVKSIGQLDESNSLIELNSHLFEIGWMAMLESGNPIILSIAPSPVSEPLIPKWQNVMIWVVMTSFLTLAGSAWLLRFRESGDLFDSEILFQSLSQFSLPIIFVLILVSDLRKRAASSFGIDVGHLVPISFPFINPIWPFGIVGLLSQRRSELITYPDRRTMALVEIITPLILFMSGTFLTLLGLSLTSSNPPLISESPITFNNNPLITILSLEWLNEGLWIKLQWLHLSALAGISLSILSWILILPIPGFPGDRLLHALLGPEKMTNPNQQTPLFVFTLVAMVLVFVNTQYSPWLALAIIAALRRFSPENSPPPLILDEAKGISDEDRLRFGAIFVLILLAGFPGLTPTYQIQNWDAGIDTSNWVDEIDMGALHNQQGSTINVSLELKSEGVVPVSGWLQFRLEGQSTGWLIESDCFVASSTCRFDDITQSSTMFVNLSIVRDEATNLSSSPMILRVLIDEGTLRNEHEILLKTTSVTAPIDPMWILVEDSQNPRICISIDVKEEDFGELIISNPFWRFENETNLSTSGLHDVCLRGHEGALQSSSSSDNQFFLMGPALVFERNNSTQDIWWLPVNNTRPEITFSPEGWFLPNWFASSTSYDLTYGVNGSPFCSSSEIFPEMDDSTPWNWTFGDQSTIKITSNSVEGILFFPSEGWMSVCQESEMIGAYELIEGPDVMIYPGHIGMQNLLSQFVIINRGNETLPIGVEWTGDSPNAEVWNVSIPTQVSSKSDVLVEVLTVGDNPLYRTVWVSIAENQVTVNLAARCPVNGC
tara:strand:+ start:19974 stop:22409 length:2436 start_codon:yes stop_codon:yes gene_type:complete